MPESAQTVYALSLWEPWAILIPLGEKKWETRHWKPPEHMIGCLFVIHAAKRWTADERRYAYTAPFQEALRRHGYRPDHLPLGAAVGTARLLRYIPTEDYTLYVPPSDYPFGNYGPERYAWEYGEPELFETPIPCRGYQGIWRWQEPA